MDYRHLNEATKKDAYPLPRIEDCQRGIYLHPSKTEVVKNWPVPTTVTEVRSFVGFASCYRCSIEGLKRGKSDVPEHLKELFVAASSGKSEEEVKDIA